jgi:hypothetical protein
LDDDASGLPTVFRRVGVDHDLNEEADDLLPLLDREAAVDPLAEGLKQVKDLPRWDVVRLLECREPRLDLAPLGSDPVELIAQLDVVEEPPDGQVDGTFLLPSEGLEGSIQGDRFGFGDRVFAFDRYVQLIEGIARVS